MNSSKRPIIVTVANNEYSFALKIMLKSIEVNLDASSEAKIYVLYSNLSCNYISEISNSFESGKLCIGWIKVNNFKFMNMKIDGHITIDTYYRLLIEELFPQYSKVIYLDADIVVNRSICELWDVEVNDNYLLAVPMSSKKSGLAQGERGLPAHKMLGIPGISRIFNAGVMVMNLTLWRRDSVSLEIIEYLRKYKEYVLWWDQDGLNCILYGKWRALPAIWNVMPSHLATFTCWQDSLLSEEDYRSVWQLPAIIHYAGPDKPWFKNYHGLYQEYFLRYVNLFLSYHLSNIQNQFLVKDYKFN